MGHWMLNLLCCAVLACLCLEAKAEYGVSYYTPPQPSYAPSYYAPPPVYEKPVYYETYDTKVDYREANATRRCGILPAVHRNEYGYERDDVAFGEYPWQVQILDSYQTYLCAGAIISPRHVLTSAKCLKGKEDYDLRVRIGEFDLLTDHNYLEVYNNYEISVCKKHLYYPIPQQYAPSYGYGQAQPEASNEQYTYDAVILELSEDIDFDVYPQAEPVCLPEYYERSKDYYYEKTYSYTTDYYGAQTKNEVPSSQSPGQRAQEGVNADLECYVAGYRGSPLEKFSYREEKQEPQSAYGGGYGYSYKPPTYYDYYEQSKTPKKAKVQKIYEYEPYQAPSYTPPSYGYDKPSYGYDKPSYGSYAKSYKTESWEAEYYYDACKADLGAPIFCLVPGKYEQEKEVYYTPPAYYPPPAYTPPAYTPPAYTPPAYTPPAYTPPAYTPPAYTPPAYTPPAYQPSYPKYKRAAEYYQPPSYQPAYQPPQYQAPAPAYQAPAYQAPAYQAPAYQAPAYQAPAYQARAYQAPAYQAPAYQAPAYQAPAYQAPAYEYQSYAVIPAEKAIEDYRRAVVVGIVTKECESYGSYGADKKIAVTPVKDILSWILNVIQAPNSCSNPSYTY